MSHTAVVTRVLHFDVTSYVDAARPNGRGRLDPALRAEMAALYEDLRPVLADAVLSRPERRQLRIAELVLQNEWKLSTVAQAAGPFRPSADDPVECPGSRNLSYANMRLLNEVVGSRHHTSDAAVESRCWDATRYLVASWLAHEDRMANGDATWCRADPPGERELADRVARLRALRHAVGTGPLRAAASAPRRWSGYAGPDGRANVLEYLLNLPFGTRHEEGTFLRCIHLTEVATWGIMARVLTAIEWLKDGAAHHAAGCLDRATAFADLQVQVLQLLRRTMAVDRFRAFRADTGHSSAVQSVGSQLLYIHLFGVHPAKVEALRGVPENTGLLLYGNAAFTPLWAALEHLGGTAAGAGRALAAARRLDETLFRWRRMHLGLAYRYLPPETGGTGGTAGAAYLEAFYRDRMFDTAGNLRPYPAGDRSGDADVGLRARPVFTPYH